MSDRIPVKNIPSDVKIHRPSSKKPSDKNPRDRIYVRAVKGLHQKIRQRMNIIFMAVFMIIPWLTYEGHQAVLFDLLHQKFSIFSVTLWPQDLTLLAGLFMIGAFALFAVTVAYGRVWCGYLCPQTVWTLIFIWFEEKFEGTRNQRIKLDKTPMNANKFKRKFAKHTAWIAFSLLTGISFIGYFVPVRELVVDFFTLSAGFWVSFWVIFFAFCTYGNAGWMREIMCLHMCPYARFQSAMFDQDTFTVTYDEKRGESRGPRSRKKDPKELGLGDCIDCNLCVQVCPTGIDIRNGLQYECINCGACIDACDDVMENMGYEKGLISYTTAHNLQGKTTNIFRSKLIGYAIVLAAMVGVLIFNVIYREPVELDIIRDRNQLYRQTSEGLVENVYTLKITNKLQQDMPVSVTVSGLKDSQLSGDTEVIIRAGEVFSLPLSLAIDPYDLKSTISTVTFTVTTGDGQTVVSQETNFFSGS